MQRVAWTDERLDDLAARMDAGFDRVDRDIRELRSEVSGVRGDLKSEAAALRGEIAELRTTMRRVGGGIIVAMIAAVLTNNL